MPTSIYRKPGCHIALPVGKCEVGFVFICPGQYEEKYGIPCSGQTGRMLEAAIPLLFEKLPTIFSSATRKDYLITNAWAQVEYRKKTSRSRPRKSEVLSHENLEGLYHEVKSLQYIVACGILAHNAVERCRTDFQLKAVVARAPHTSRQALGCPTNADLPGRLDRWAVSVVGQFQQEGSSG